MNYEFQTIEKKWQRLWADQHVYETDLRDFSKPKYYILDMFPYPSGKGLHVGHVEGYTASDIIARMKRMQGFNVLHPMGWDAFGLPAEQYAIDTGNHPATFTQQNIETFKRQLNSMGFLYDWTKELSTADPRFYRWTQSIFRRLFVAGLAKNNNIPVNWCDQLNCVLANDEVVEGKSVRGGFPVRQRKMKQWSLNICQYAEQLLEGLNNLDWPESTKEIQRNWIGKSEGLNIRFTIRKSKKILTQTPKFIDVFTTRCDTIYGVTFIALSPEHKFISTLPESVRNACELLFRPTEASDSNHDQSSIGDKVGLFTGVYAINPINDAVVPIWIANYVDSAYGEGAVMGVPAHDARDHEFAVKYDLPMTKVIETSADLPYLSDGIHCNSNVINGMNNHDAGVAIANRLVAQAAAKPSVRYRLREWVFSRQRYWGEPIPIVHCEDGPHALEEDELPLILPSVTSYLPNQAGASPLDRLDEWVHYSSEKCIGRRETCTMPGSAGSSWYFLRYLDPKNDRQLADSAILSHWLPVDLYLGGVEHATGHLLYARFWNRFLYDQGVVPCQEPFAKLVHQGMILGANGEKMSKSRGNVVNPDDVILRYGADSLRLYEMFMGPIDKSKPWDDTGLEGANRFIHRMWRMLAENAWITAEDDLRLKRIYHSTVKKVTEDLLSLNFNTAISQLMIFVNAVYKEAAIPHEYATGFVKLMYPITPHVCEELWSSVLHGTGFLINQAWPSYDLAATITDYVELPIQINGKIRTRLKLAVNLSDDEVKNQTLNNSEVHKFIGSATIKKIYVVAGKMISITTQTDDLP